MFEPADFTARVTRNVRLATAVTVACAGIGPLSIVLDLLPRDAEEAAENGLFVVFLCSPLLFLIALALPATACPSGPTAHGPLRDLVPRWILALAVVISVPALAAPLFFTDPFLERTEVTDGGRFPFAGIAWVFYACFAGGLLLTLVIVGECRGRAELDPADEPRARKRIATRAVTALVPLATACVAVEAFAIGAAGQRYRDLTDQGSPAPAGWAFAAEPGVSTAVITVLVAAAILLIGAAIVFSSPPVGDRAAAAERAPDSPAITTRRGRRATTRRARR
ncbi:hypothetical protein [Tsukamurella sp. 1534]|uniref:hypothetical protein n=1 Tax=Tsukamurella sp. 1534 TaxID=1151061 RepID=UPI0002F0D1B4|nr:hypothetical protein [Tsukamurella sp. 1534]